MTKKFMKIRIPTEYSPNISDEIEVHEEQDGGASQTATQIASQFNSPGEIIAIEPAMFYWSKKSPGCVTFVILGKTFQI
jgi:hypothetical protein